MSFVRTVNQNLLNLTSTVHDSMQADGQVKINGLWAIRSTTVTKAKKTKITSYIINDLPR